MAENVAEENAANDTNVSAPPPTVLIASGTPVNVQRAGSDARASATVLGMVPGSYIVLRDPLTGRDSRSLRALNLLITDDAIVRLLYDGVIYAFKTAIWRLVTDPEYLLFLRYPSVVERAPVRQISRLACRLPCEVSFAGQSQPGLLMDISVTGCAVVGRLDEAVHLPEVDDPVTVTLTLPTGTKRLQAEGHIRHVTANIDNHTWRAGAAFPAPTPLVAALEPYLRLSPIEPA